MASGHSPGSYVQQAVLRLRGGGGDGGSTCAESRSCYLEMYLSKKPDKADPNEVKIAKWTRCMISADALSPPCVVDMLGNLYNKEAIVKALVSKTMPRKLGYIKGLRDILDIHLEVNPAGLKGEDTSRFQCPITGQEFNGKSRFYALRSCGHVLSVRALKEVHSTTCLVCHTPFSEEDKLIINGTEEEVEALRVRLEEEKEERLKLKGGKKDRKKGVEKLEVIGEAGERGAAAAKDGPVNTADAGISVPSNSATVGGKRRPDADLVALAKADAIVRPKGSDLVQAKKVKAAVPLGATKKVYASIFTSSSKGNMTETYMCRSLPLARN
eukprot:jgi/Mesen1/3936/ME000209S02947